MGNLSIRGCLAAVGASACSFALSALFLVAPAYALDNLSDEADSPVCAASEAVNESAASSEAASEGNASVASGKTDLTVTGVGSISSNSATHTDSVSDVSPNSAASPSSAPVASSSSQVMSDTSTSAQVTPLPAALPAGTEDGGAAADSASPQANSSMSPNQVAAAANEAAAAKEAAAASQAVSANQAAAAAAQAASTNSNQTIADGTYVIQSALGQSQVLDVQDGATDNCGNVQVYESNMSAAQQWNINYEADGYYSIQNAGSGKYLDIAEGVVQNGQNVQQYEGNATLAQRWLIQMSNGGFKIVSALDAAFALDLEGGNYYNCANVQIYETNGTDAQTFYLISVGGKTSVVPASDGPESGIYVVKSAGDASYALDVASSSYYNGANVQIYEANDSAAQRWYISEGADGFYTVQNVSSGKALDAQDGNVASGTNVQQYDTNATNAQKWSVGKNADGSYTLINALSGMALDVSAASYSNCSNVQLWHANGSAAQKWVLSSADVLASGVYSLYSMLNPEVSVIDDPDYSTDAGMQLQLWSSNCSSAQKYRVVSLGNNQYTLQALASGLYVTSSNDKLVQAAATTDGSQTWTASFDGAGIRFTNALSGKNISVANNRADDGSQLVVSASAASNSQRFRVVSVDVIEAGYYLIVNANGNALDVADGRFTSGANVQVWNVNYSGNQTFYIQKQGKYYSIVNARSLKALEVAEGSTVDGANVQQYAFNGSGAQLWIADLDEDCNIIFRNANDTSKVLDLSGNSADAGANVDLYTYNGSNAQQWKVVSTAAYSVSGDSELDQVIANCWDQIGEGDNNLRRAYNWVVRFPYLNGSKYPSGNWSVPFAKEMYYNGGGNCYRYAALFCWLAKSLGYDANVISGWVVGYTNPVAPHGWVEIHMNGTTYTCDPDMQHEMSSVNWYMCTYATSPTVYHFW